MLPDASLTLQSLSIRFPCTRDLRLQECSVHFNAGAYFPKQAPSFPSPFIAFLAFHCAYLRGPCVDEPPGMAQAMWFPDWGVVEALGSHLN